MKEITPLERAAMRAFARDGYDGTSMRSIAQEAGMRASSLYAHFKGKDDLYLTLIALAFEEEGAHLEGWFQEADSGGPRERLFAYLKAIGRHSEESEAARFLLGVKFFPPMKHRVAIDTAIRGHEMRVLAVLRRTYQEAGGGRLTPSDFAEAALALVESLECELVFACDSRLQERVAGASALLKLAFLDPEGEQAPR